MRNQVSWYNDAQIKSPSGLRSAEAKRAYCLERKSRRVTWTAYHTPLLRRINTTHSVDTNESYEGLDCVPAAATQTKVASSVHRAAKQCAPRGAKDIAVAIATLEQKANAQFAKITADLLASVELIGAVDSRPRACASRAVKSRSLQQANTAMARCAWNVTAHPDENARATRELKFSNSTAEDARAAARLNQTFYRLIILTTMGQLNVNTLALDRRCIRTS